MEKFSLDKYKKQQNFKVPAKYFEELPLRIQTKINKIEIHKVPTIVTSTVLKWSLAPVLVVSLIVGYMWLGYESGELQVDPKQILANVSTEDLIQYIENSDMTSEEILEVIENDESIHSGIIENLNISNEDLEAIL